MTEELRHKIDKNRMPVFICIGSMKSMLDSVAPRIGTKLKEKGYDVVGTEDNPVTALNIVERIEKEISCFPDSMYQKIYIDCTIAPEHPDRKTLVINRGLQPGGQFNKALPSLGNWFIGINLHEKGKSTADTLLNILSPYYGEQHVKELVVMCTEEIINVLEDNDEEVF